MIDDEDGEFDELPLLQLSAKIDLDQEIAETAAAYLTATLHAICSASVPTTETVASAVPGYKG